MFFNPDIPLPSPLKRGKPEEATPLFSRGTLTRFSPSFLTSPQNIGGIREGHGVPFGDGGLGGWGDLLGNIAVPTSDKSNVPDNWYAR